jgi:antitoxin MazE
MLSHFLEVLMRVVKWGNSLAIRLPRSVVEALRLKEGDSVEIYVAGPRTFEIEHAPAPQEAMRRLRKFRGRLPRGFRFSRLDANEQA